MIDQSVLTDAIAKTLHSRVEPVFLPLSVRNNRIEDVYLSFLKWLAPGSGCSVNLGSGYVQSPAGIADVIMEGIDLHPMKFSMPDSPQKREQVRRWIQAELVVEPGQTNRAVGGAVSVKPLHLAVAECFSPPGKPPAYGRFLAELLSRVGADELRDDILLDLGEFFGGASEDQIARLLQDSLGDGPVVPQLRSLGARQVWNVTCAQGFQRTLATLLTYRNSVSRRVMLEWLYAVFTFYATTYFLSMAALAEVFARDLESIAAGAAPSWSSSLLDDRMVTPRIPYGRRNESHAHLMKQFPANTSQIQVARVFVATMLDREPEALSLEEIEAGMVAARDNGALAACFRAAMNAYPTKGIPGRNSFRLSEDERNESIRLYLAAGESEFAVLTRYLNFEDMGRSANNILEWQFYSTLARDRQFGFARPGSGEVLHYEMSDALLLALLHCHCAQSATEPTLSSFCAALEGIGFQLDGGGRQLVERDLVRLGLMEDLADASDAKQLIPLYAPEGDAQ